MVAGQLSSSLFFQKEIIALRHFFGMKWDILSQAK